MLRRALTGHPQEQAKYALAAALSALLTFSSAQLQAAQPMKQANAHPRTTSPVSSRGLSARRMIGMPVLDRSGAMTGKLEDLVVRMQTGEVRYVVVSREANGASDLYLAPAGKLRLGQGGTTLEGEWEPVEAGGMMLLGGGDSQDRESAVREALERFPQSPPVPASVRWSMRCISAILDAAVDDQRGERLGTVSEVIVDVPAARIRFAIVDFGENGETALRPIGLPLHAFALPRTRSQKPVPQDRLSIAITEASSNKPQLLGDLR
jgi:sporulation protein YlmC with PRC-barrel domain